MKKLVSIFLTLIIGLVFSQVEVVFWHGLSRDPDKSSIEKIIKEFENENPDIKVKVVIVPAAETDSTKLLTAVAAGTGPDLVYLDRFTVSQRAANNVLEPMEDYLKKIGIDISEMKNQFYSFAIEECIFNGKMWALPFDTDVRILLYNAKLLKKAGYNEPPKTVYEMINVADKLTVEGKRGRYETVGFIPWYAQGWPYTWIFAFEGKIFDKESGKFIFATDPGVIEAYKWQEEWANRFGYEALNAFGSLQIGDLNPFTAGKLAMIVDGNWTISGLKMFAPKDFEYKISGIPTKSGKPVTWAGGWSLAIPRGAKHKEAAAKLAYYIATKGQVIYCVDTLHLPTYKPAVKSFLEKDPSQKVFVELLDNAKTRPPLPVGALLWDKLVEARDYVLTGKKSVEQALLDAQKEVQEAYDKILGK
ncbi:ABC transporter substrate-binding protein [Thermosipho melanesiensis]|uniref:Extracellular solute-binding protein, family 1 n=2 Tax=Thermosipho melanesiensis TaxID=46541 RepID=A6LLS7_THEM4|nr:ABC transporter substrate-binding protein [Thermosipho melanesiensis]ABR30878.1 extracellular solute-binding protein, family 1 [Thermosipho melanesiensis BI429]APT73997.1 ABC transporter substrate-binding protein [Thermosipho melanesiensis]OOC35927.1 ABC transporter substrate-binding protein [Thermosipho melanesiensis]OOC38429.1 ABC transporter substrate-binding protein [Thermosipho melanesiensis]OOC38890.1 ABC transporter substrate-binding protein [Thermosipho melanesiensis]